MSFTTRNSVPLMNRKYCIFLKTNHLTLVEQFSDNSNKEKSRNNMLDVLKQSQIRQLSKAIKHKAFISVSTTLANSHQHTCVIS